MNVPCVDVKTDSKAISASGRGGLQACEMLRIPHCIQCQITDGGEVVGPANRPPPYSTETLFFCGRMGYINW
jgi:hypothetical protein